MIELTTAYHKINKLTDKYRVVQGGQGAGKTYSILAKLFYVAYGDKNKITIVTDTYPSLRDGVISDMKTICATAGFDWENNYHKSEKNLRFDNGSEIQFRNTDANNFQQLKGVRRDYLFINEANKTSFLTIDQMLSRTNKAIYIDYNPDAEFWAHERILNRDDAETLILTYIDNEKIGEGEKKEIELRIDESKKPDATDEIKQWVQVYAHGQLGTFSNRRIYSYQFCDKIPKTAKRIPSGMDFGVSPDPTIKIDCFVDGVNLYIDEVFCENNLMPEKIQGAERLSVVDKLIEVKHPKGQLIIGDSAAGTTLRDMRKHGYNVAGVKKTTGSQITGIRDVRGFNLFITRRSVNMKKGLENWFFKVDTNGKIIPEPDGHEPDGLAALRYIVMTKSRW